MIKRNLKTMILTTVIILLPIVAGLLLWNQLPDQIPTHWDINGEVDTWSDKAFAVFALPLFIAAIHWVAMLVTSADPKNKDIDGKMLHLVLWICPVISLLCNGMVLATAMGIGISVEVVMPLVLGAMFLVLGNYLPKCKQNYTIGIKVSWALEDEANWNATHRFAGWVWTIGSLVIMATAFFGSFWIFLPLVLIMGFAPMVYSYLYYRKHRKDADHEHK